MYPNPTKVKDVHELAPEQQKALSVLMSNLPKMTDLFLSNEKPCFRFCHTGFMAFSSKPLPKLPHEETWIWNQSNGKVTVKTECGNYVTLQKLNTRKKKNCPKPPSYKVWMCYLSKSIQQPPHLNFIWCEKGIAAKDSSSSDSPDSSRGESSGSDGSSDTTSPESYQSSPPDSSSFCIHQNGFRRASVPNIPPLSQTNMIYSPTFFQAPQQQPISSKAQPPQQLNNQQQLTTNQPQTQIPKNDSRLPSLEDLVIMRKNQDSGASSPNRKRSLPQLTDNLVKKRKLSHPISANIFLPPLRLATNGMNSSNDFQITETCSSPNSAKVSSPKAFI